MRPRSTIRSGFTIVELIIVIAIIGILAGIVVVSYNGMQERSMTASLQNDLKNAQDIMEIAAIHTHEYPNVIPPDAKESAGVTLTLKTNPVLPHYSNLSDVQGGVLLAQICQDLIDEGRGKGINMGGGTDSYIMSCGNWTHDSMQVTGWDSPVFHIPVADNALTDYADTYNKGDAWHPNQNAVVKSFFYSLHDRYITEGGTFPITSFWDTWASGVQKEALPDPDPPEAYANTYCIEAHFTGDKVRPWHIIQDGDPAPGGC